MFTKKGDAAIAKLGGAPAQYREIGDKNFIAFGFGEDVNPAREEGAHMHPVAWTLTSLDAATEARIRTLVKKAVA